MAGDRRDEPRPRRGRRGDLPPGARAGAGQSELVYNYGRFLQAGDPAAAETWLARAAELRPNLAPAWYHLGLLRAARGDGPAARAAFRQALAWDPAHRESRKALQ